MNALSEHVFIKIISFQEPDELKSVPQGVLIALARKLRLRGISSMDRLRQFKTICCAFARVSEVCAPYPKVRP